MLRLPKRYPTASDDASGNAARPMARPDRAAKLLQRLLRVAPPQVFLALLMTAVVSAFVFAVSELTAGRIAETRAAVRHVSLALTHLSVVRNGLLQAESSQRGYLVTGTQRHLEPFDAAVTSTQTSLSELAGLAGDELEWRGRVEALRTAVDQRMDQLKQTLFLARNGDTQQAQAQLRSAERLTLMESIMQRLDELEGVLTAEIDRRNQALDDTLLHQRIGVGIVVLINLVFLAVLANMLIRQFTQREQHRAELQKLADKLERTVAERTADLSSLSSYLQSSSEREKARLARDLHDELGGILTSAKIDIAWLEGHCKASDPDVVPRLKRLAGVLDEAVDLKRRVVENLRPSLLDHLGLGPALAWHVKETCQKAGLEFTLDSLPDTEVVAPEMAIAMYRMVQEALNNTIKYAKATKVSIGIERRPDGYRLVFSDNGIGISGFRADRLSHGLAGMRQRARALGGRFELRTAPGAGTTIEAFFPLGEPAAVSEATSPA
jgi:signal transduction histidine kinase